MAIAASDIKFYLSGGAGNSDPDASLGGAISTTAITDATLNNLFDDVSGDEALAGDTEYRGFYVKNDHGALTWSNVVAWIQTNTPGADTVEIAIEAAKGSPCQTIADESTAPTGPSFSAPANKGAGLSLGALLAADVYMIWVKRIVGAACGAYNTNSFILKVEGDSPA